jgi:hypothetical protein
MVECNASSLNKAYDSNLTNAAHVVARLPLAFRFANEELKDWWYRDKDALGGRRGTVRSQQTSGSLCPGAR